MTYLLDTNVVSELVKVRPEAKVVSFVAAQQAPLMSTISLHELTYGAERAADPARRAQLLPWIAQLRARFGPRMLDIDADIAELAGRLRAVAAGHGKVCDPMDALIGASAMHQGATLATRNVRDFTALGVTVFNPWD